MTPTIRLNHFLRGPQEVTPTIVDGRREWTCPNRPMMRPWPDCYFKETGAEIEALLAKAQFEGVGHNANQRLTGP